jgi:ParB-like chromosome segregation protein Spo0J
MTTFAGYEATIQWLKTGHLRGLHVHRAAGLFRPFEDDERDRLRASMQTGYDHSHPIILWSKTDEIVDGRNRRDLAVELGCRHVPVAVVDFPDEAAVTAYIVAQNLARRHLTTKERAELAARLVNGGMSTRKAAKATGVSQMTAQRAAAKARAGESSDSPGGSRTTGADGKTYPATKPKATQRKPKAKPTTVRRTKAKAAQPRSKPRTTTTTRLTAEQREFDRNLYAMVLCANYACSPSVQARRARLLNVDDETWAQWSNHIAAITSAADELRAFVAEARPAA